ncbi:MAG: PD40 domain-containing protein, partial [Thermomicrobiales bacterium]|nr:PD40 domain-containing protein [Thermomicrobiales bacterium]
MWPIWHSDRSLPTYRVLDLKPPAATVDLMVVGADGTGARRLATDVSSNTGPVWSPDGRSLAFTGFAAYDPILDDSPIAVHLVEGASSREASVSGDRFALVFNPAWRPAGRMLVFVAQQRGLNERPQPAPGDLFLTTPNADRFENLTRGETPDLWSAVWRLHGNDTLISRPRRTVGTGMTLPKPRSRRTLPGRSPRPIGAGGERDLAIADDAGRTPHRWGTMPSRHFSARCSGRHPVRRWPRPTRHRTGSPWTTPHDR